MKISVLIVLFTIVLGLVSSDELSELNDNGKQLLDVS